MRLGRMLAALLVFLGATASLGADVPEEPLGRGALSLRQGAFGDAAASLEAAVLRYEREANGPKRCEALLLLAQARLASGQHRRALEGLTVAWDLARKLGDRRQTAAALGDLGNVHLAMGEWEAAETRLQEGLAAAREAGEPAVAASILNNLGNLRLGQKRFGEAAELYRDSVLQGEKAEDRSLTAQALVNGASAAAQAGRPADAGRILERASAELVASEDSYSKAYGLINAGLLAFELRRALPEQNEALVRQACASLQGALSTAQRVRDERTVSYAYGHLGRLYEEERQYPEALELTRRAVFAAQKTGATEALYKWHWQAGRVLGRLGELDPSIASYRLSIQDLQAIRDEMSSCYANPESSYQKTARVVCFELVGLLLRRASLLREGEAAAPYLVEARDTLEALKVFELREYFKDDCLDAARVEEKRLDAVSDKAAVIYPILLPDRVELLVSVAGRLERSILPVGVEELTRETRELRRLLVKRTTWEFLPHAQKLYDWLIRPLEGDLGAGKVDTLVFVPDGALRTVPMAALHDGRRFLIERYPIAITPSLSLTDPKPIDRGQLKVLSLGLTRAVQGFPALPYVADELGSIGDLFGGHALLDEEFRVENMEGELQREPFSIVHIASHGQFGGDVNDTFLLAFDEKFTMERFGQYVGLFKFREEPLDLLALSACETAAGDDRAALGLAGVAVRAGARSALATLWHVNDPASYELVTEFYRQLSRPSTTRAAALQAAQRKLLDDPRYDHPGYWAPFLLINNWL